MTISQARTILGEKGAHLSDEEIQRLVDLLDSFSRLVIDQYAHHQDN